MRTLSSSARCCQNICSTRIVGRSAVMHGRYCSFFTRNKSFSRNLHRVCIIGKVPRRQFLRESRIENRVEYRDSILDPRFSRESRIECQLTFGRYCKPALRSKVKCVSSQLCVQSKDCTSNVKWVIGTGGYSCSSGFSCMK